MFGFCCFALTTKIRKDYETKIMNADLLNSMLNSDCVYIPLPRDHIGHYHTHTDTFAQTLVFSMEWGSIYSQLTVGYLQISEIHS